MAPIMKRNDASDAAFFTVNQRGTGRTVFTVLCATPKGASHRDHIDFMALHTVLSISERIFFLWKYVS